MKRKTLGLGLAAVVALAMLSTSAFALTVFGNNSQKGSLLIYPRIQVGEGADTLITLTNDSSGGVHLKCFYATSDPIPTPNARTAAQLRGTKHFEDFTIDLTHNQPIAWWAKTGRAYSDSQSFGGFVAPPFGNPFPDGVTRPAGDLKCWAVTDDGTTQRSYNHLFGTASVFVSGTGQAYEYTAWAFQSADPIGTPSSTPGVLNLGQVSGGFSVSGGVTPLGNPAMNLATGLHFSNPGGANSCTGFILTAIGGINGPTCNGASSTTLDLAAGTLVGTGTVNIAISIPGWITLSIGGVSFDLTLIQTISRVGGVIPAITLAGTGVMHATGFPAATGIFTMTAQGTGGTFSFSSTQIASNVGYDACPNILLGNFLASGTANNNGTTVTLASCNQDLRQAFTPTITKLTWTFFNQDEAARTGTHFCADSWYETTFPVADWPFTTFTGLGTEVGYFRIETTADTQICGPDAKTSAYVGVISQTTGAGNLRGTNLTGRGPAPGVILYDPSRP